LQHDQQRAFVFDAERFLQEVKAIQIGFHRRRELLLQVFFAAFAFKVTCKSNPLTEYPARSLAAVPSTARRSDNLS
jgi:hypothetical protein